MLGSSARTLARRAARPLQQMQKRFMGGDGEHHVHYVFEPPFNKVFVGALVWGGVALGGGLIGTYTERGVCVVDVNDEKDASKS